LQRAGTDRRARAVREGNAVAVIKSSAREGGRGANSSSQRVVGEKCGEEKVAGGRQLQVREEAGQAEERVMEVPPPPPSSLYGV